MIILHGWMMPIIKPPQEETGKAVVGLLLLVLHDHYDDHDYQIKD